MTAALKKKKADDSVCGSRTFHIFYLFLMTVLLLFSLPINDRLFRLDKAPKGRIFISVKSRDMRWPFQGSQLTPWQQDSRLKEKEIKNGENGEGVEGEQNG